ERVAWALLEFANSKGYLPQWVNVNIIAKRCGLARETASRILSQWQKEGILQRTREGFVVLEPSKLQAMLKPKSHSGDWL
ncbi:MAG: Crp/Fnr family transcriptional regulator, partial [Armatimonadota bacterium]